MSAIKITGGCLCKVVRYEISAAPVAARYCWCRVCQYIGAGSATVNVCFERAALTVLGRLQDYRSVADSGNVMHRSFCPTCGTHLFSEAEVRPHLVFVRSGSLDDAELIKPSASVWVSQAPSWACIDPSLPQLAGQPAPQA